MWWWDIQTESNLEIFYNIKIKDREVVSCTFWLKLAHENDDIIWKRAIKW